MSTLWSQPSGISLGTYEEQTTHRISLPLIDASANVIKISGELPPGTRIVGNEIVGTPYEVIRTTEFKFVLRAFLNGNFDDRTYTITIEGADSPEWVTEEGDLKIGPNGLTFILDSSIVDFQLQAIDRDLPAGDEVEYYIKNGNGQLPPGTRLTSDGRIVGIIDPLLALDKAAATGYYDTTLFDKYAYDFGFVPDNGYDSFFYDTTVYDFSIDTRSPKKLNRYYEFIVTASDGDVETDRKFKIFVVGDDFLRADNTQMFVGSGVFTADGTFLRKVFWLTPENFGFRRANNYVTLYLEVFDPSEIVGYTSFISVPTNPGTYKFKNSGRIVKGRYELSGIFPLDPSTGSPATSINDFDVIEPETNSTLPPGLTLDSIEGKIAGRVPYQSKVTQTYKFTVKALRQYGVDALFSEAEKTFTVTMLGEVDSIITWNTDSDLGTIRANSISNLGVNATTTVPNAEIVYRLVSGKLPNGLTLNPDGEIIGKPRQYGDASLAGLTFFDNNDLLLDGGDTTIDRSFRFTIEARDKFNYSAESRTFVLKIDDPTEKLYSNIYYRPMFSYSQRIQFRNFINSKNIFDPSLIYRSEDPNFGVQETMQMLVFAGIETKGIENYVAAISKNHKRKRYRFGELKSAVAYNPGTRDTIYEVVYVEIVDPQEPKNGVTRSSFTIDENRLITADQIRYHPTDDETPFGRGYTKLVIEGRDQDPEVIIDDVSLVIYLRSGNFFIPVEDNIQISARNDGSGIVNIDYVDNEPYRFRPNPENTIRVDSDAIKISDINDIRRYISNTQQMRERIKSVGEYEKEFLPLWMRSSQPNSIRELGYVKAVPLCYCKPGGSDAIIQNIKNYMSEEGFDFKKLDFDVDRYVIDSVEGNSNEQYLIFANYQFNV